MTLEHKKMKELLKLESNAHVTYHYPTVDSGGWQVHVWGYPLSDKCQNKLDAVYEAIENLKNNTI